MVSFYTYEHDAFLCGNEGLQVVFLFVDAYKHSSPKISRKLLDL